MKYLFIAPLARRLAAHRLPAIALPHPTIDYIALFVLLTVLGALALLAVREIRISIGNSRRAAQAWDRLQAEIDHRGPDLTDQQIREFHAQRWQGD